VTLRLDCPARESIISAMKARRHLGGDETRARSRKLPASNSLSRGFEALCPVADLFSTFTRPWYVAGGWALDLFLGRVTRKHHDIDVAIFREDQIRLRDHLAGWQFQKVVKRRSHMLESWDEREWLSLPVHEVHARGPGGDPEVENFSTNPGRRTGSSAAIPESRSRGQAWAGWRNRTLPT